jgi:hypothetical protein
VSATRVRPRSPGPRPTPFERLVYALAERAEGDARARRLLVAAVNAVFRAIAAERRRGGRRLLDLARASAIRWGRWRAHRLKERLGVDVSDMADMARVQD